jgi:adenosine deaminase
MRLSRDVIQNLPKIELHCHLDGSISLPTIRLLAEKAGIAVPSSDLALGQKIKAPKEAQSLMDYLAPFDYVLPMLQTEEALSLAAYDVIEQAQKDNIRYIEVRFAPTLHTAAGLTLLQVVQAVTRGLANGEKVFGVQTNALLCGMRHESLSEIMAVVDLFSTGELTHVAGFDLAGVEEVGFPEKFAPVLEKVRANQIPLTLHAGECGCARNVMDSVKAGASRIGHGVAIKDSPETWAALIAQKITLEMAPTSNFQTKAIDCLANYPFKRLFDAGVRVTINTDNRTVSDTTLNDEYAKIAAWYDLTEREFRQIAKYAFDASFMSEDQRELLASEFV